MAVPEIRLLQAAIVLAEELNFSRAAERLHIVQPTLSKQISELENQLGLELFERSHQMVELTDAGRQFVEEAREALLHAERAVLSARAAYRGADEVLNVGTSPHTDPYLVSMLLAIHLPLFPDLKVNFWSYHSHELVREILAGNLDLALTTGIPDTPRLSCLTLQGSPLYVAMSEQEPLAGLRELRLEDAQNRNWILFSRHVNPFLEDMIQVRTSEAGVHAASQHHVTTAEEAVPLILAHEGLAFLTRTGAWRIARDGITMRPLSEESLRFTTSLAVRSDSKSRLANEFVKATARKLTNLRKPVQGKLFLSA